jgi:hypothetical protein
MHMKRSLWLPSLIASAVLILAACGTVVDTAETDPDATLTSLVAPDHTITSSDAELLTAAYWRANETYGGPFDVCWVIAEEASEDNFVLDYTPPGYVWELGVVSKLGEPNTHFLFENPVEGDEFETDGYDQVIACKNVDTDSEGGCSLTQGYWKTHSAYGPAPYDATWALLGPDAEDTAFYSSGQSWYQVLWTAPRGDAYYNLAHQFIAAKLNALRGTDTSVVDEALAAADTLLAGVDPGTLTRDQRREALDLAETLDDYNNGLIGPGHCD